MLSTFAKLNLKDGKRIVVVNTPDSFEPELAGLTGVDIVRELQAGQAVSFALVFVMKQEEVDAAARAIASCSPGDIILWFAFVKGTSKRYKSEIGRDRGWQTVLDLGFDTVRSVAIDEDWSALRFRRLEYIKR